MCLFNRMYWYNIAGIESVATNLAKVDSVTVSPATPWVNPATPCSPHRPSSPTSDSFLNALTAAVSPASAGVGPTPLKNCGGSVHSVTTVTYSVLLLFYTNNPQRCIYTAHLSTFTRRPTDTNDEWVSSFLTVDWAWFNVCTNTT